MNLVMQETDLFDHDDRMRTIADSSPSVSCGPRELNLPVPHSIPIDGLKHAVMFKCNDSRPCIQDESEPPTTRIIEQ